MENFKKFQIFWKKFQKVGTYNEHPYTCHPVSIIVYFWPILFYQYLHLFPSLLIIW